MTLEHIHRALATLAPDRWPVYDDEAPSDAAAPWLVVSLQVPERIIGETAVQGGVCRWRITCCALTGAQARVMADACHRAWSMARIAVDGWKVGAAVPKTATGPYDAGLTALDTNLRYQVVTLTFDLTIAPATALAPA